MRSRRIPPPPPPEKSPAAASRILVGAPAGFGSRQPEKWRRRGRVYSSNIVKVEKRVKTSSE